MGTEFQEMDGGDVTQLSLNWHLKMVEMVNFVLYVFYCN